MRNIVREGGRFFAIAVTALMSFVMALSFVGCGSTEGNGDTAGDPNEKVEIRLQAAASLTDAMDEIISDYTAAHPNVAITPNYDSSGTLSEQIIQGAPADLFISANQDKMDVVEQGGLLADGSGVDLLENELVLIAPKGNPSGVTGVADLDTDAVSFIAVGEPKGVPVGKYTEQALTTEGLLDSVAPKMVQGKDVRAVLTYVETGDADAGFVYKTDAMVSDQVEIVTTVGGHDPVVYPAALIKDSDSADAARAFLDYIEDEGSAVLEKYGFKAL